MEMSDQEKVMARLEVTQEQLDECPKALTEPLKKLRMVGQVAEMLEGSNRPAARKWLRKWRTLPSYRDHVAYMPEMVCLSAGLDPFDVLSALLGNQHDEGAVAASLLAATQQVETVKATLESAKTIGPDGVQDRKMLHQHSKFLPMPKTQFVNMPGAQIDARTQVAQVSVLPSVEDETRRLSERFGKKLIAAPQQVLDAEEVDGEEDTDAE